MQLALLPKTVLCFNARWAGGEHPIQFPYVLEEQAENVSSGVSWLLWTHQHRFHRATSKVSAVACSCSHGTVCRAEAISTTRAMKQIRAHVRVPWHRNQMRIEVGWRLAGINQLY